MSRESILKIKQAEEKAERIVTEASQRAQTMRENAKREGEALCERIERETIEQLAQMFEKLRERAVSMGERMEAENAEMIEELKKQVALRRKIAEKIIIRRFEEKCR